MCCVNEHPTSGSDALLPRWGELCRPSHRPHGLQNRSAAGCPVCGILMRDQKILLVNRSPRKSSGEIKAPLVAGAGYIHPAPHLNIVPVNTFSSGPPDRGIASGRPTSAFGLTFGGLIRLSSIGTFLFPHLPVRKALYSTSLIKLRRACFVIAKLSWINEAHLSEFPRSP